jgi:hypothetical protein
MIKIHSSELKFNVFKSTLTYYKDELANGHFIDEFNIEYWYKNGQTHREDGPAYISTTHQIWRIHGEIHRKDGPAYIINDFLTERKFWYYFDNRADDETQFYDPKW